MATLPNGYGEICIQSEAADGSIVFVDSSGNGHSITKSGSVFHSTDQSKFGNSAIYFGGNSSYLDFIHTKVIDFWIYLTAYNTYLLYADEHNYIYVDSTGLLTCKAIHNRIEAPTHNISLNQWTHIYFGYNYDLEIVDYGYPTGAYYWINSVISLAVNGALNKRYDRELRNIISPINSLVFMTIVIPESMQFGKFNGYAEEIRGYNTDPTEENFELYSIPYPAYKFYVSGHVKKKLNYVSRIVRAYDRESGELIGSATAASDGYFLITIPKNDVMVQVICLDDDTVDTEYEALIYDDIFQINVANPTNPDDPIIPDDPFTEHVSCTMHDGTDHQIAENLPISTTITKHIIPTVYDSASTYLIGIMLYGTSAFKLTNIEFSNNGIDFTSTEPIAEKWAINYNGRIENNYFISEGSGTFNPLNIYAYDPSIQNLHPTHIRLSIAKV